MKGQTSKELESASYRCLFEGIKSKEIGSFLSLVKDIHDIYSREILIFQTLFCRENVLDTLRVNHSKILEYFRDHNEELRYLNFANENVLNVLENLKNDISPLDLYIENAKKLESLKINKIQFESFWPFNKGNCPICRDKEGKIISISKYYTDGEIVSSGDEIITNSMLSYSYSKINFSIHNESFILMAQNGEYLPQYRSIYINNFGFDGSKLPLEEELQSYEIPNELIRKRSK